MKKLLLPVLFLAAVFTGCEKTDYNKLEGSVWEAETDEAFFTLHFEDELLCTLTTARTDGTYSANRTSYVWWYGSAMDSKWGEFFLHEAHRSDLGFEYAGAVENKTLYLRRYDSEGEPLPFKRK